MGVLARAEIIQPLQEERINNRPNNKCGQECLRPPPDALVFDKHGKQAEQCDDNSIYKHSQSYHNTPTLSIGRLAHTYQHNSP